MADVNANIGVNIDTSEALAQLKSLQRQISQFNTSIVKSSETAALAQKSLTTNLVNSINAIGSFNAELRTVRTTSEQFTASLEGNKFSMREYFRYAGGATKSFGKLFKSEFDTITNVAEERVKRLQTQYIKLGRDTNGAMKAIAVIPKELNMADYGTQVQIAAQRQALFNQLMKQGSTNLINFGKNTQWAGRQLMVGFTIPLSILGSTATRVFMDMETQAIKFKKVYGDLFTTREETQQALTDIQALAGMYTKYGIAVSQTVGLAADAAAAGFQGIDLQRQTAEATRLSVLGQIDSQKALETTISLQNAFRSSSADLASQIDFLNAVENQTVVSLDDITTAIPKVAPVIQQLGGNVKDLAFFLAAMKEGGVNASEGANALKSGLAALINPTARASQMLAGMGININKIIETNKGNLRNTVVDFAKALDTLDPLTRARAIEQLFGKFQFARLSTLFDNVTRGGTQAARVLELASASVQDLAALSEQELGLTAASSMNKFKKAIEDIKAALVPVGQTFLDAVTPIINFVGGILEKFNDLSSGTKKVITILTVGLGAVGPILLMTFGLLANGIGNLIKLFLTLRGGYLKLTGQSQVLGEQTQYLTNEQLQAEAVAHSLDQSHAKLIQTLTMETGELNQLAIAYQRATAAMQRFAAGNPGAMAPRKKMATGGIIVGPGTGTSDSVPIMASNGEAIIPAKQTKKFGGLINGIIADNIPGFAEGRGAKGRPGGHGTNVQIPGGFDAAHFGGSHSMTGNQLLDMLGDRTDKVAESLRKMVSTMANADGPLTVFTNEVIAMSADLNKTFGKTGSGKKVATDIAKSEMTNPAYAKVRDVELQRQLENAKVPIEEIRAINEQITSEISTGFESLGDITEITAEDLDRLVSNAYKKVADTDVRVKEAYAKMQEVTTLTDPNDLARRNITNESYKVFRKNKKSTGVSAYYEGMERMAGAENVPYSKEAQFRIKPNMGEALGISTQNAKEVYDQFSNEVKMKLSKLRGDIAAFTVEFEKQAELAGIKTGEAYTIGINKVVKDPYVESRDRKSPHRMASADGKDDGVAYSRARTSVLAKQSQLSLYGREGGITPEEKSARRKGLPLSLLQSGAQVPETNIINTKTVEKMKAFDQRLSRMNNAIMGGTFALTSLAAIGSTAGGTLGQLSGTISKFSGLLFGLMAVTQLLTQAKIAELVITRVGIAKKAVDQAKAFGSYGMGGVLGKAGKLGGIARFGLAITKFLGPIGLVTTALTVGYVAYKLINNRLEENRQKLQAFGDAVSTSKDQLKSLGDYFGVVPTKTGLENTTQEKLVSNADRTAINQFKASDTFKKDFAGDAKAVSRLSNADATLALQTKGAELLGKGFTQDQVNIIITAIQEEAGKSDLNINFKSIKLDQLDADIRAGLESKLAALPKFISDTMTSEMQMGEDGRWYKAIVMGPEAKAEIENQGKAIKAYLNGLSGMIQNGTISFEKFNQSFDAMGSAIKKNIPDTATQLSILNASLSQMDSRLAKGAVGIQNFESKMLLAKAAAIGLNLEVTNAMVNALMMASLPGATAEDMIRASAVASDIEKMIKIRDQAIKALNKPTGTGTGGGGESWLTKLAKQTKAVLTQTDAFYKMRDAGIEAGLAMELASNPEFAEGISKAAEKGGKAWEQATAAIKKYRDAQEALKLAEIAGMDQGDYELQRLNKAQAYIDLQSHFIQMQYSAQIDSIDKAQQENDLLLQRIAYQETLINDRYNPIIDRLQKIQDLNKSIADIEAKRIDVISALSSGDIAGGVRALSELRTTRASQMGQSQIDNLNAARERELALVKQNNLTKQQIDLQNQKLALDKKEIESTIAKQTANLTYFNMTRLQIDNAAKALDLAKSAGLNINDPAFLNNVLDAAVSKTGALEKAMKSATTQMAALLALQESARTTNIPSAAATITAANVPQIFTTTVGKTTITTPWDTGAGTLRRSMGGMVPKYFASGGFSRGTDTIPAMLTAGEYVVRKSAVDSLGVGTMNNINNGNMPSSPVYNYSLSVNVGGSNSSADDIARAVMSEIKRVDSQRIRGVR